MRKSSIASLGALLVAALAVACVTDDPAVETRARAAERFEQDAVRAPEPSREPFDPRDDSVDDPGRVVDPVPRPEIPPVSPPPRLTPTARAPETTLAPSPTGSTIGAAEVSDLVAPPLAPERRRILDDLRAAMTRDTALGAQVTGVELAYEGDVLVLTGDVRTAAEKALLEELARAESGGAAMRNDVRIADK